MKKEIPIINIFCHKLPFVLSNQLYNEYQSRLTDAKYLIANYKTYKPLKKNTKSVELFLALAIFYKRVITNLDGAIKFHGTITRRSEAKSIQLGTYNLDGTERNKMLGVVMSYHKLISKFSITPRVLEFERTNELLVSMIQLKAKLSNGKKAADKDRSEKEHKNPENWDIDEDEFPF